MSKRLRFCSAVTVFSTVAFLLLSADTVGVNYVESEKVTAALAKGGSLVRTPEFTVSGSHRDKGGQVEVHEKETDILYVVEGEATFVTGGTMVGGKTTRPGQLIGTDIQGGQTHRLRKGDVITIPAGMPHWFKEVPASVSYFVVKVLKP
jgi:quercetin dioxygenase-like cupin family protein